MSAPLDAPRAADVETPASLDLSRVVVLGLIASGKSTFSKSLAGILQHSRIELDDHLWEPNWRWKPADDFRRAVERALSPERWIVDGNYRSVRELIGPQATAVIWLDYGFPTVFRRAFMRTLRHAISKERLHGGNVLSFRRAFFSRASILWLLVTRFSHTRDYYRRLRDEKVFARATWIEFRKPADAERFLRMLRGLGAAAVDENLSHGTRPRFFV